MFLLGLASVYLLFKYFFIRDIEPDSLVRDRLVRDRLVMEYKKAFAQYLEYSDAVSEKEDPGAEKKEEYVPPDDPEFWSLLDD